MNDEPSELATPQTFWETLYGHAVLYGGGYALIDTAQGRPVGLYNLPPDRVTPFRLDGSQWYAVETGQDARRPVPAANVLHVPGLGYDGQRGYPVIELMRDALGIGRAAQRYTTKFFQQGGHVGGTVETDRVLTPEQIDQLRQQINQGYTGLENSHKWMVLQSGLKAKPLGVPPENAQLSEVVNHHLMDVCRIMGVEPFVVKEYGRATWSNLESQNTQAVMFSLMPWILRSESEINRKLFTRAERQAGYFVGFNADALIRGDHTQQIDSASKRLAAGLTTPDEERALLDLPPYPGGIGATPTRPANTVPLDGPAAVPAPANTPPGTFSAAAFSPLIADAATRVGTKTEKATQTAQNKFSNDPQGWVAWGNAFAQEQAGYSRDALTPILAAYTAATGREVPEGTATSIGERYGGALRGHFSRLRRGEASEAPDLGEITTTTLEKGMDAED